MCPDKKPRLGGITERGEVFFGKIRRHNRGCQRSTRRYHEPGAGKMAQCPSSAPTFVACDPLASDTALDFGLHLGNERTG